MAYADSGILLKRPSILVMASLLQCLKKSSILCQLIYFLMARYGILFISFLLVSLIFKLTDLIQVWAG